MLDPSSSEDTGGDSDPEVVQEAPKKPAASPAAKTGNSRREGGRQRQSAAPGATAGKGAKDGGATGEEEARTERERIQKEEEERKVKLQIYVFALRCIAYPFNAKQPTDMARRQQKFVRSEPGTDLLKLVFFVFPSQMHLTVGCVHVVRGYTTSTEQSADLEDSSHTSLSTLASDGCASAELEESPHLRALPNEASTGTDPD